MKARHLGTVAASLVLASTLQAATLVSSNSVWSFFKGTNEASSPDTTAWRALAFDDELWNKGPAPFFYGEPLSGGTQLSDMQNNYSSFFLRQRFVVANLADLVTLTFNAACDDGFVAWINGQEVARYSAPTNGLSYNSLASTNAVEPVGFNGFSLGTPAKWLTAGTNVLTVQAFNISLGSSDIVFDAELVGSGRDMVSPTIVQVAPEPGVVSNLTRITVTFSEPVTGVNFTDLMVNDTPATSVSGSGAVYTFGFAQPAWGLVQFYWIMVSGIADLAQPPNPFNPTGPNASWMYELVDPTGPHVASLHPPANLTVHSLSRVEVLFDKPVTGVNASDLLVNDSPATSLSGLGAGPYVFEFPAAAAGTVQVSWVPGHDIMDDSSVPHPFMGSPWSYTVDPQAPAANLVINEFMAQNVSGLKDEEGDTEGWIEVFNQGTVPVNLAGWALTDDAAEPGKWVFPELTLPAQGYLVVFASGKDRKPTAPGARLHANFKLALAGEYLGLFNADAPRQVVSELGPKFPEQRNNVSFGIDRNGEWRYFYPATPGAPNGASTVTNVVAPVHFSVQRGYYQAPFNLSLATETPDAIIRYTLDGSPPTETNGVVFTDSILVNTMRIIRAAAFKPNHLPSVATTHTYLYNLPVSRRLLPALSLVTATNNLYGKTGIMEYNPRNTLKHGIAWERPVSAELIRPEDNQGFHVDCGLRVQGGGYIRGLYNYRSTSLPESKYSFRLYFRGDYGTGQLNYRWFPDTTVESFENISLRAGMNDPTNPFIRDPLARTLAGDAGQPASHSAFVNLFLNGVYKGYYNPSERIDPDFLRAYHGGTNNWDVIAAMGEVREGDLSTWTSLRNYVNAYNPTNPAVYQEISRRLDLVNFVDYLLPLIYADTDDWPHNNWRAARERAPDGQFRMYVWDAEWSFGYNNSPSHNTIAGQLSNLSPPWGGTEIQTLFRRLKLSPEFRLLFADRVHKHFFNNGALTDPKIRARYEQLKGIMRGTIPGFVDTIGSTWIPQRRQYLTNHFATAGLLASSNAPVFSQFGGRVPKGYALILTTASATGTIYCRTDGGDPRLPFTGAVAPEASSFQAPIPIEQEVVVKARTLTDTNWSALTEAAFQVAELGLPLRITEIMYNPEGGDAYEFVEIQNTSATPVDLSGVSLDGVGFRFAEGTVLPPAARVVLISDLNPTAFKQRYPDLAISGIYGGSLSNGGERLALSDRNGRTITSVAYRDASGWPKAADGGGRSLEVIDPNGDPNDPANWRASVNVGGSPGLPNLALPPGNVRLNEVLADNVSAVINGGTYPDFIELHNAGNQPANLTGWSLSNDGDPRKFVFPNGTSLAPGGFLVVWCDNATNTAGLHAGFALGRKGESLFLFDAQTNRGDAMSFGLQVPDLSLGRVGADSEWQLTEPTPGEPNLPASLGSPASLMLNEIMANPPPGQADWVELFNANTNLPVALAGLYLTTSNALFQLKSLSFIAPGGFVQLHADAQPGPDHLDFKLPAAGGVIVLLDPTGDELSRFAYPAQREGVSLGLLPDGSSTMVSFLTTASPGASNYLPAYQGPVLNEVLARSEQHIDPATGRALDWVELFNPGTNAFDLTGMSLSVDQREPGQWLIPPGTELQAEGFLVVWCDGSRPASTNREANLNLGRSLTGAAGGVYLFNPNGQLVDSVEYGFQLPDQSIGRVGSTWTLLTAPTPGAFNSIQAPLGDAAGLRLNECMASPASGDDWFELFNPDPLPVNMAGLYLTDDPSISGQTNTLVGPLSFIAAQGWVKWIADGQRDKGRDHVGFSLDRLGETLRLHGPNLVLIDNVDFAVQTSGVSQGRLPDGATNIVSFPRTPTPGESNYLPLPDVVINEVLTHTDPPLEDAIELHNPSTTAVDLSGWFLSNSQSDLRKFRIPDGTGLPAGAFQVFYEYQFNPTPGVEPAFTLNSAHGDEVHLSEVDASGALTGFRAVQKFAAAANGVSFGRYATSVGVDFVALDHRTFGVDTPASLAQFRGGTGLPNAYPKVGPVVINELMYHPVTVTATNATENAADEFIELYNMWSEPIPLFDPVHPVSTWRLQAAVEFVFPTGLTLAPGGYLVVVHFDPALDPLQSSTFRAKYAVPANVPIVGPFHGRLDNAGDNLELCQPDPPQMPPHPDAGFVPYVLVDHVRYSPRAPWSGAADGSGSSLQRNNPTEYGNDPVNWIAALPTAGRSNASQPELDADGDSLPDEWEVANGLNPAVATGEDGAQGDPDHDGLTNLEEYLAGTNPREVTVVFVAVAVVDDQLRLEFNVAAGKAYVVQSSAGLSQDSWTLVKTLPVQLTSGRVELLVPLTDSGSQRFFRVRTSGSF